ncbi:MAG: hypothetical protein ACM3NH_02770, partial [Candidatus Saccharibacteria bacterium]
TPTAPEAPACTPKTQKTIKTETRKIEASYRQAIKDITKAYSSAIKAARSIRSASYKTAKTESADKKKDLIASAQSAYDQEVQALAQKRDLDLSKTKDKKTIKAIKETYKVSEKTASNKLKDAKKAAENERKAFKKDLEQKAESIYSQAVASAQAARSQALAQAQETRTEALAVLTAPCPTPQEPPVTPPPSEEPTTPTTPETPAEPEVPATPETPTEPSNPTTVLDTVPGQVIDAVADAIVASESAISYVFHSAPADLQDLFSEPMNASERMADRIPGGKTTVDIAAAMGALGIPVITSAPVMATSSAIGLYEFLLILFRSFREFLGFIGLRKKRRFWGTAYDSMSKQPLDPVVVRLIDAKTDKVIETAITDLLGRFGFLPHQGEVKLTAAKKGYLFPTVRIQGDKDEIYENLYRGEILKVNESEVVAPNIPMDPLAFDWNQQAKMSLIKFHPRWEWFVSKISDILFAFGFLLVLFGVLSGPNAWNLTLAFLYLLVLSIRFFLPKHRLYGRVMSKDNHALENISLEIFHPGLTQVVLTKSLVSKSGRFFLKANPGKYLLRVKQNENTLGESTIEIGQDGVLNQDLRV